ncbi:TPA: hypothetical protein ACGIK9_003267 [Acinetobacter baumannii]|uniref:hypothetical protein n=1 Tax=Acinetobacter baumannii TaxID=470 RepID=UPI00338E6703
MNQLENNQYILVCFKRITGEYQDFVNKPHQIDNQDKDIDTILNKINERTFSLNIYNDDNYEDREILREAELPYNQGFWINDCEAMIYSHHNFITEQEFAVLNKWL